MVGDRSSAAHPAQHRDVLQKQTKNHGGLPRVETKKKQKDEWHLYRH
jgi:hypothetical protein